MYKIVGTTQSYHFNKIAVQSFAVITAFNMGAEQSLSLYRNKTTASQSNDGSFADVERIPTNHTAVEPLSEELQQFLREKQQEFNRLIMERDRLRIDLVANDVANRSILQALIEHMKSFDQDRVDSLADVLAWKSIALGAEAVLLKNIKDVPAVTLPDK